MIRGLLWLPLLGVFYWLAWAGWNEYQKLEAYRSWAEPFDHAKYDIYAVLGQKGSDLVWGKPTRQGPANLQSVSLHQVEAVRLRAGNQVVLLTEATAIEPMAEAESQENEPKIKAGSQPVALELQLSDRLVQIPFTDLELAEKWGEHLQRDWQNLRRGIAS